MKVYLNLSCFAQTSCDIFDEMDLWVVYGFVDKIRELLNNNFTGSTYYTLTDRACYDFRSLGNLFFILFCCFFIPAKHFLKLVFLSTQSVLFHHKRV